jgi:hypothetical protein
MSTGKALCVWSRAVPVNGGIYETGPTCLGYSCIRAGDCPICHGNSDIQLGARLQLRYDPFCLRLYWVCGFRLALRFSNGNIYVCRLWVQRPQFPS